MGLIGGFGIGIPYYSYDMLKVTKPINVNASELSTGNQVCKQNKIIF